MVFFACIIAPVQLLSFWLSGSQFALVHPVRCGLRDFVHGFFFVESGSLILIGWSGTRYGVLNMHIRTLVF